MSRFRRDERAIDEDEELWFNEDEEDLDESEYIRNSNMRIRFLPSYDNLIRNLLRHAAV